MKEFQKKAKTSKISGFLKESEYIFLGKEKKFIELWARYLVAKHGYEFYWFALHAKNNTFGLNLDERLTKIDHLIREYRFHHHLRTKTGQTDFYIIQPESVLKR
ncbi:MAG: hypothetical protein NT166_27965 [Candidatus Aminicenantes bacterium]|nr:hypothetical protein [Candidatus Aminicenantes bacterium]